jgi:hypothetical protein
MQGEEIKVKSDKLADFNQKLNVQKTAKQNSSLKTKRTFVIRKGKKRAVEIVNTKKIK